MRRIKDPRTGRMRRVDPTRSRKAKQAARKRIGKPRKPSSTRKMLKTKRINQQRRQNRFGLKHGQRK